MSQIHQTAIVDPSAEISEDVVIGPYSIVEAHVKIGQGCRIGGHVTLGEHLKLGQRVQIYNYACIGTASQDLKHTGQHSWAEIGDDVTIREFATVNRGTRENSVTVIKNGALLMAYSHVAHECVVGEKAILVNNASLGGEVVVGRKAIIGGLTPVHQFCRIGTLAFIGAGSKIAQDIPPFFMADGHPARPRGINKIGLQRDHYSRDSIRVIQHLFHELYNRDRSYQENLNFIAENYAESAPAKELLAFCSQATRGLAHPRKPLADKSTSDLILD